MNRWALVLHIYQPPNQRPDILELVAKESYDPLLTFLESVSYPVTLNVTGSLTEQLALTSRKETLARLQRLQQKPNIVITTTGYTHALFPLWPDEIVVDQLEQNWLINRQYLDANFDSPGAWLPECAYEKRLEPILISQKVRWTVIDESSLPDKTYRPAVRRSRGQLRLAVRHRALSQALATSVEQFGQLLEALPTDAVAALDGEVFGHFDQNALTRLAAIFQRYGKHLVSMDELTHQPAVVADLHASTWETDLSDRKRRQPFPLWHDHRNRVHEAMWPLYQAVWDKIKRHNSFHDEPWVRRHFTNAISSCWFWWANPKRTAGPFKMKIWNPDMIVEGLTELVKAVRSDPQLSPRTKWRLETQYADVLKLVWQTHWKIQS